MYLSHMLFVIFCVWYLSLSCNYYWSHTIKAKRLHSYHTWALIFFVLCRALSMSCHILCTAPPLMSICLNSLYASTYYIVVVQLHTSPAFFYFFFFFFFLQYTGHCFGWWFVLQDLHLMISYFGTVLSVVCIFTCFLFILFVWLGALLCLANHFWWVSSLLHWFCSTQLEKCDHHLKCFSSMNFFAPQLNSGCLSEGPPVLAVIPHPILACPVLVVGLLLLTLLLLWPSLQPLLLLLLLV